MSSLILNGMCGGRILKNTRKCKKEGATILNSSGAWMEQLTAGEYLDHLEKAARSSATDGYWMFPQVRMSRNCYWITHPDDPWSKESLKTLKYKFFIDRAGMPECDPEFFVKLKNLNNKIEDWRSGWWFNFRKWISGFFR